MERALDVSDGPDRVYQQQQVDKWAPPSTTHDPNTPAHPTRRVHGGVRAGPWETEAPPSTVLNGDKLTTHSSALTPSRYPLSIAPTS